MAEGEPVGSASIEIKADVTGFEEDLAASVNAVIGRLQERLDKLVFNPKVEAAEVGAAASGQAPKASKASKTPKGGAGAAAQDVNADVHVDDEKVKSAIDKVFAQTWEIKIDTEKLEGSVKAAIQRALAQPFQVEVQVKGIEGLRVEAHGGGSQESTTSRATVEASAPRYSPAAREEFTKRGLATEVSGVVQTIDRYLRNAGKSFADTIESSTDPMDQLAGIIRTFGTDMGKWIGPNGTLSQFMRAQGIPSGTATSVLATALGELKGGGGDASHGLLGRDTSIGGIGKPETFMERHGAELARPRPQPSVVRTAPVTPTTTPTPSVTPQAAPAVTAPQAEAPQAAAEPERSGREIYQAKASARGALGETLRKRDKLAVSLTGLADQYGPVGDRLPDRDLEGTSGLSLKGIAESIDKGRGKYRGLRVVTGEIKTSKGEPVAARYEDSTNPATRTPEEVFKTGKITIDPAMILAQYQNKAWRESRELPDKTKATPLGDENFPTPDDYLRFVLEHEYQHSQSRRRTRATKNGPRESMGAYEDRINQAALAAIRSPVHEGVAPRRGMTMEQLQRQEEERARTAAPEPGRTELREGPGLPRRAGPRTATDVRKGRSDLGSSNWMDPMRLVSTKDLRAEVGGLTVDLSKEVRALIRGAYSDLVEVVKRGASGSWVPTGEFIPLGPTKEEAKSMTAEEAVRRADQIAELRSGSHRPQSDLSTVHGGVYMLPAGPNGENVPVRNVTPRAALVESAIERIAGPREKRDTATADAIRALLDPGSEENDLSATLTRATDAYGRRGLPTRGEAGKAGLIRPDADLQRQYEAAVQLESVGDRLMKAQLNLLEAYDDREDALAEEEPDWRVVDRLTDKIERYYKQVKGSTDAKGRHRPGLEEQYLELREIASPVMHETWTQEERQRRGNLSARGTATGETLEAEGVARAQSRRRNWERQGGPAVENPIDEELARTLPEAELAIRSVRRRGTRFEPEKAEELIARIDAQVKSGQTSDEIAEFSKSRILYGGTQTAEETKGVRALMENKAIGLGPLSESLEKIVSLTRSDPERRRIGSGANVGPNGEPMTFDIVLTDFAKTMQRWVGDFGHRLETTVNKYIKDNKVKGEDARELQAGVRMYMDALRSGVSGIFAGNLFAMEDEKKLAQREDARTRDQMAGMGASTGAGSVWIDRHAGTAARQAARNLQMRNRAKIPRTALDDKIREIESRDAAAFETEWDVVEEAGGEKGVPVRVPRLTINEEDRQAGQKAARAHRVAKGIGYTAQMYPGGRNEWEEDPEAEAIAQREARESSKRRWEERQAARTAEGEPSVKEIRRTQAMARLLVEESARTHPEDAGKQREYVRKKADVDAGVRSEALEVLSANSGERAYASAMINPEEVYQEHQRRLYEPTQQYNPYTGRQEERFLVPNPRMGYLNQMYPQGERDLKNLQTSPSLAMPDLTEEQKQEAMISAAMRAGTDRLARIRRRGSGKTGTAADQMAEESFGKAEPTALLTGEDYQRQRAEQGVGTMHPLAVDELVRTTGMPPFGPMTTPRSVGVPGHVPPGVVAGGRGENPPGEPPTARGGRGGYDGMQPGGSVHVIIAGQTQPVQVTLPQGYMPGASGGQPGSNADILDQVRSQSKFKRAEARFAMNAENTAFASKQIEDLRKKGLEDKQIKKVLKAMGMGAQAEAQIGDTGGGGSVGMGALASRRRQLGLDPVMHDISGPENQRIDVRRAELSAEGESAQRKILRRGFTASVTDVFQAPFFTKQNAAVDRFQRESGQLIRAEEALGKARTVEAANLDVVNKQKAKTEANDKRTAAEKKRDLEVLAQDEKRYKDAMTLRLAAEKTVKAQEGIVGEARAELPGRGRAMANLGIGAGAAAGAFAMGTMVYQLAGQVMGMISQGLEAAAGPAVERALGFAGTTSRVSGEASRAIIGAGGATQAGLAATMAPSGISGANYEAVSAMMADRATTQAGNQQLRLQMDYMHAAENLKAQGAGTGYDKNLTYGTGGFMDTALFGIPSTAEILKNELIDMTAPVNEDRVAQLTKYQQKLVSDRDLLKAGKTPQGYAGTGPGGALTPGERETFISTIDQELAGAAEGISQFSGNLEKGQERLDFFNSAAEKGGEKMVKLADLSADPKALEKSLEMAVKAGLPKDLIDDMRSKGIGFTGAEKPEDIMKFMFNMNRGAITPSPEALLDMGERERQARLEMQDAQTRLRIGTYEPAEFGMAQAVAPIGNQAAVLRAAGIKGPGVAELAKDIEEINTAAEEGIDTLKEFVKSTPGMGQFAKDFSDSFKKVQDYGQDISDLQIDIQMEQAAYAAHQYEFSIYQANRSLRDARGLLTGTGNSLGAIQRQQWDLQRESQSLSMGMTQRQINFQKALAGFATPGDTPQERAARIEQAEIEAEYAQKQLNIQKKLFALAGRGFNITASRSVQDLTRQLSLLEEGRKVTLDTMEAEKRIQALTVLQSKENKKVETFYSLAVERTNDIMGEQAKLVAATGKNLAEVGDMVIDVYIDFYKRLVAAINGENTSNPSDNNSRIYEPDEEGASGLLGTTAGPTTMLVGEAGTETVAVLRNPRNVPLPSPTDMGGSGGQSITINITGNTVRSDQDLETLAYLIERKLNQKAALLGYRKMS